MTSKKIGVLTFHRATNYGAILQAYGLVSYLNVLGYDAEIIDYKPHGMAMLYSPLRRKSIKGILVFFYVNLRMLRTFRRRKERRNMFWKYIKNVLPLTTKVKSEKDIPHFDIIIVGSDQVWSTCFTGGLDNFYYGQFDTKGAKLVSYAGSAAEDMEGSFYSTDNALLLNSFDALSVREDELQTFLQKQLPNKKIVKVLDPTLMAGVEYFDNLIKDTKPLDKPYVFIYQVIRKQNEYIQAYARQKARELGCNIVEIKDSRLYINSGSDCEEFGLVDPTQFVALYKYATYIITTSFHGTAFSVMFNRPFDVVSVSPEVDSRAKDLLHQLGLDDHMISLPNKVEPKAFSYGDINRRLEDLRKPSREFINKVLA